MSYEPVISLKNLSKCYQIYDKPRDRLLQMLFRGRRQYFRELWALQSLDLEVMPGEIIGVVGRNGSGKSTLLQLICGTLTPTTGEILVNGRVAALLELGAGFNPEFSGRENIYVSAAISGMSRAEIEERFDEIVDFSGICDFIDRPVKTYSSGMYVRLAFSIATHVDPDILVIDEALSVGDGLFAKKSFERIMELKDAGKTILFCSHSIYQVEALCGRALWLDRGQLQRAGVTADVTSAYGRFLNIMHVGHQGVDDEDQEMIGRSGAVSQGLSESELVGRLTEVKLCVNMGSAVDVADIVSGEDDVNIFIDFLFDPKISVPNLGIVLCDKHDVIVTSVGTHIDGIALVVSECGRGSCVVCFPKIPLLKGEYFLHVYLLCDRGVHVYDSVCGVAKLNISQNNLTQGVVSIPRTWEVLAGNGQ